MSEAEIRFLTLEDVLEMHEMQIERYGGATGMRDQGLLESAIGQPQASFGGEFFHHDLYEMAPLYIFNRASPEIYTEAAK